MKTRTLPPLPPGKGGAKRRERARRRPWLLSKSVLLLLLVLACTSETPVSIEASGPIIIISVDTLRADHLPIYGGSGVRTPHLDALAGDSIVFENAYSQVPLTLPSHASMLTGRLPASIGVRNNLGYRFDASVPSLPTLLKVRGYETGAVVSSYVLRGDTGLGDAFDHYDDRMNNSPGAIVGEIQRRGDATVSAAIEWLDDRQEQRVFLFLHLFEPHTPYDPPEPYASEYAGSPYDGEIATADAAVGRLLDHLRQAGLYDDATIVFMSDHGEGLGDHGESEHGIFLYREAIHVPLFVKLPGSDRAGERIDDPVGLIDIFPTIGQLAGLDFPPDGIAGRSLLGPGDVGDPRRIYSETMYPRIHLGWSDLASLIDDEHHYIDAPTPELYDLVADPGETRNILSEERRTYASMRDELAGYSRELEAPEAVTSEEAAKLAALGYLGSGGSDATGPLPDPKDRIGDLESFMVASRDVRAGDGIRAIAALEQIVERNPAFADGWTLLGKAYDQAGRLDDAVRAYQKTIEVAPMLAPGTALSIAEIQLKLGRYEDALDHVTLAREAHPATASLVRSRALVGLGQTAHLEDALEFALEDPATREEAKVVRVQGLVSQRRLDEALEMIEQHEIDFGDPVPGRSFTKADILARKGRLGEAKTSFLDEIAQFPRNREAYVRLAALHLLEGNASEAERVMKALSTANPGPATRAMIAEAYRRLGRPDLAARW